MIMENKIKNFGLQLYKTDELCDAIKVMSDNKDKQIAALKLKLSKIQDEKWKDEELCSLKSRIDELESRFCFELTQEENRIAEDFIKSYNKNDFGAIGGAFTYKFTPTGVGTICSIIGPDKKEKFIRTL